MVNGKKKQIIRYHYLILQDNFNNKNTLKTMEKDIKLFLENLKEDITEIKSDVKEVRQQTTKTNGRVSLLEYKQHELDTRLQEACGVQNLLVKETEFMRLIFKYPIVARLMFIGLLTLLGITSFDILKNLF